MRSFIAGFVSAVILCVLAVIAAYYYDAGGLREAALAGERAVTAQRLLAEEYGRLTEEYRELRERDKENLQRLERVEGELSAVAIQASVLRDTLSRSGSLTSSSRRIIEELDSILRRAITEVADREEIMEDGLGGIEPGPSSHYNILGS